MNPEGKARQKIDALLECCGWLVQTKENINLEAGRGVAICELSFYSGEPDYTLFADGKAIGTVEAKPEGNTLTSVEEQSSSTLLESRSRCPHGNPRCLFVTKAPAKKPSSPTASILIPAAVRCFHFTAPKPCSRGCSRKSN